MKQKKSARKTRISKYWVNKIHLSDTLLGGKEPLEPLEPTKVGPKKKYCKQLVDLLKKKY